MLHKSGELLYMNEALCKNLQNIDRNKMEKSGLQSAK